MNNIVTVYRGKRPAKVDGDSGLSVTDVQGLVIDNPVYNVLGANKLTRSGSINFDRNSLASHTNRNQKNVWARADTTTNFVPWSENFANWDDPSARWTIVGTSADPFGGTDATEINLDVDTDVLAGVGEVIEDAMDASPVGGNLTVSFWIRTLSGTVTGLDIGADLETHIMIVPTGTFQRVTKTINSTASGFTLSINPRGKTGARIALFGVQVENNNTVTDLIDTAGAAVTDNFTGQIERESDSGWLIEESKENVVHYSGDMSKWTPTNVTVSIFSGEDPFNVTGEKISLDWASVSTVNIETTTESLSASTAYTVSMWTFVAGGSLTSMTVSLGGGTAVALPTPSTSGFVRVSVSVTSGATTGIIITATSNNQTALLKISGVQAELETLTSYIKTGSAGQTRLSDIVTCDFSNIPRPDKPWSFIFRHVSVLEDSSKKFIFTNNETGSTEFSCYFIDDDLILKNGSSITTVEALDFEKICITFDETTLKIYKESTLLISAAISATSFIATTLYIGMDSTESSAINAHISYFMFYDVAFTQNDITYLMGA